MVIDITRCNGCYNCFLACRDEYCGNDYPPYSAAQPDREQFWMRIFEKERGKYPQAIKVAYIPTPCMHCDNPTCVKASRNGEIYQRDDGIVIIDPEKAKGNKDLVSSCPYRVIYWNEATQLPQKCTLCAHLLDAGWKEPRCVEACPTGALIFGDLDNPDSEVAKLVASGKTEVIHPEYGLQEKVSYIGLPKRFIAGSVIFGDADECAKDVSVTVTGDGVRETTRTNVFGDFEVDGLAADTGYAIKLESSGYDAVELTAITKSDVYLGDIILDKNG
jgi:Fe-S-cluster-containing dehydrogenase component